MATSPYAAALNCPYARFHPPPLTCRPGAMAQTDVVSSAPSVLAFQESARQFLQRKAPLARLRRLRGAPPGFEREMWCSIGEMGWTGILIPEDDGGLGLGLGVACAIAEEVGRNPISEPYIAGAVQSMVALQATPASPLKAQLIAGALAGHALLGLAWPGGLPPE